MIQALLLLVAGVGGLVVMLLHPVGPALAALVITPFDAIFFTVFGVFGNLITFVPIIVMLVRLNPGLWVEAFLGTPIQRVFLVLILLLSISHAMAINHFGVGIFLEYARKVTQFVLAGFFAWYLRDSKYIGLFVKVFVVSMTVFMFLSMIDFYLGVKLLPAATDTWGTEGALATEYEENLITDIRFSGAGLPINRTAQWILLPGVLALGWALSREGPASRLVAFGCFGLLVLALAGTVSRSGIAAFAAAIGVVMVTALRFRIAQVLLIGLFGAAAVGAVWLVALQTGLSEGLTQRFAGDELSRDGGGRLMLWASAIKVWGMSPLFGVGARSYGRFNDLFLPGYLAHLGTHNSYMLVLANSGLVGFIPYLYLLASATLRLMRKNRLLDDEFEYWRPYFLAGFVGMMLANFANEYTWERNVWIGLSYAIALQRADQHARSRLAPVREASGWDPLVPLGSAPSTTLSRNT